MEIVIGVTPEESSDDAIALGLAMCDTIGATPVFTHVYPKRYDYPSAGHVDAEWEKYMVERGNDVLDSVRRRIDRPAEYELFAEPSSGRGLGEVADERSAEVVVIGSSPGGPEGRIHRGSTSDRLLHSSHVPVTVAPREYRVWAPARIKRIVFAYQPTPETQYAFAEAVELAQLTGCSLHVISVLERKSRIYRRLGKMRDDPDTQSVQDVYDGFLMEAARAAPVPATHQVLVGDTVGKALREMKWHDDDLMVVGSSGAGPARRVFMSDTSYKLMKAATVPMMLIPHSAEAHLEEVPDVERLRELMKLPSWTHGKYDKAEQ